MSCRSYADVDETDDEESTATTPKTYVRIAWDLLKLFRLNWKSVDTIILTFLAIVPETCIHLNSPKQRAENSTLPLVFWSRGEGFPERAQTLLGGSWDLVRMVISTLTGVVSSYTYSYPNILIVTKSHDPLSILCFQGPHLYYCVLKRTGAFNY